MNGKREEKTQKCSMLFCDHFAYPKSAVLFCHSPISNAKNTKRKVGLTYAETKPTTCTTDVNMMDLLVITAGEGEME